MWVAKDLHAYPLRNLFDKGGCQGVGIKGHVRILRYRWVEQPVPLVRRDSVEGVHGAGEDGLHVGRERLEEPKNFGFEQISWRLASGKAARVLKESTGNRAGHLGVLQ